MNEIQIQEREMFMDSQDILSCVITGAIILILIGLIIRKRHLDSKAPEEQVKAVLKKKRALTTVDANNLMNDDFILTFDIGGKLKKFRVKHSIYKQYNENEKGILTFKRKRFVDFTVEK